VGRRYTEADKQKALAEMRRVLRPSGFIAFYVWDYPSGGMGFDHFDSFEKIHTLSHPVGLQIQLTDVIFSGVFDAFPKLRMAFLEGGCSWVPFMMDRLDYEYDSAFGGKSREKLKKRPSEYISTGENFWVAPEMGERFMRQTIDAMGGAERML